MKRFVAIALALAFLGSAGSAIAQRIDTQTDEDYLGDEPNVALGGTIPYGRGDPSATYPADNNGIADALEGTPSLVLGVKYIHRVNAYTTGVGRNVDASGVLGGLAERSFILPGLGQFMGWHGTWTDNGDGYIYYPLAGDRVHVTTRGDCTTTPSTTDSNGLGNNQGANTGVSARCVGPSEWVPQSAKIVAYVTPGFYGDNVNRAFGPPRDPHGEPDFEMKELGDVSAPGNPGIGRYYAPSTNFDYVMVDNSLLETTVLEAISSPKTVSGGPRLYEAGASSLVEVDLYNSVDPTAESLYQTTVVATFSSLHEDCQVEYVEACGDTKGIYYAAASPTYETVGPTYAGYFEAIVAEDHGFDYKSGPHLYLDLWLTNAASASLARSHLNYPGLVTDFSHTGDGSKQAFAQMQLAGTFGVWNDKNSDGFIGDPRDPVAPCTDEYQCGAVQDPSCPMYPGVDNVFDVDCAYFDTAESAGEYEGTCGERPKATARVHSADVTMWTSTGTWGPTGVYVITDRKDATNNANDPMIADGRVPFNPYDDAVLDASDGSVDQLVQSGPITLHIQCTAGGFYYSFERLVMPVGNMGFDVSYSASITDTFTALGIETPETVTDEDTYFAW